jgi:RHS repeat-associated protein
MPGPYTFTATRPFQMDFEGQHLSFASNDTWVSSDPCRIVRFLRTFNAATGLGVSEETQGVIDEVERACAADGGGPFGAPPTPPTPPTASTPAAPGADGATPGAQDTPESLGAPSPAPSAQVSAEPRAPGTSDGRPLAEQYRDPENPMPDYDVAAAAMAQGTPSDQIPALLESVLRNEPPPGLPSPFFGRDDRSSLDAAADPVLLFTGQFSLATSDVRIPSSGFPIELRRLYRSGAVHYGPFGYNWDHNYNVYLRELSDGGVAVWNGELSEDVYRAAPLGFEPPTGVHKALEHVPASGLDPERYQLTDREGRRLVFFRPAGFPRPDRVPLVRIEDRHANAHTLTYDGTGKLESVADAAGRRLDFSYGSCELLEAVTDHTGRRWSYAHDDEIEHLVAVMGPPTTGSPDGLFARYEYDRFREHPALVHNLLRVIDPLGRTVVENAYGEDPSADDFGRVVQQRAGGSSAAFCATRLQYVPRTPDAVNIPSLRVETLADGVYTIYTFNYRGDLLDERLRLARDGSFRRWTRAYRYDKRGNLTERYEPDGLGTLFTYDIDNPDPRARGNLTKMELVAPPTAATPSRIVAIRTYEPRFHRLKTLEDERGHTMRWIYDYEDGIGSVGDVVRVEYPVATLPDGTAQPRVERFTYDPSGHLVERRTGAGHRHVYDYIAAGSAQGYLSRVTWDADGAPQTRAFAYDAWGYPSAYVDGLGNRVEDTFDAAGRLTKVRIPRAVGFDEIRFFYDANGDMVREERPRGAFDDGVIADPFLVNTFVYNVFGHLTEATYGANSAAPLTYAYTRDLAGRPLRVRDPMSRWTDVVYDERGLALERVEAAGTAVEARWSFVSDRNGNRTAVIDPSGFRFDYDLDPWGRLHRMRLPGASDAERTRIEMTLTPFDRAERILVVGPKGDGTVGTLFDACTEFDERGRARKRTSGERSTTITYDADERACLIVDQRGQAWSLVYDGLDRIVRGVDPLGNVEARGYDAAGNLSFIELGEVLPQGGGRETLRTTMHYDGRGRVSEIIDPLGRSRRLAYDARDLCVRELDAAGAVVERAFGLTGELLSVTAYEAPGAPVTHRMAYDLAGRQIAYFDPEGNASRYGYDALDRRIAIHYPDGRIHRFEYGPMRQPLAEVLPSGTRIVRSYAPDAGLARLDFVPAPGVAPTAPIVFERDGMRRPTRITHGSSDVRRTYDTQLRLRSESDFGRTVGVDFDDVVGRARITYSDGRVDELMFDELGRVATIHHAGAGASGLTGALAAGDTLARYTYRGAARVALRESVGGVASRFDFDTGRRLSSIRHVAEGTTLAAVAYVYDSADHRRIVWSGPAPLAPARFAYDGIGRLRDAGLDIALPEPAGPLSPAASDALIAFAQATPAPRRETYTLNRADARVGIARVGPSPSTDTLLLDAKHAVTSLVRTGAGAGSWPFTFDADGRCTRDDRHLYQYDALGRLVELRDVVTHALLLAQRYDGAGRVIERTCAGGTERDTHFAHRVMERRDGADVLRSQRAYGIALDEVLLESDGENRVPLLDAAMTVLARVDDTGAVVERYRFTPFGEAEVFAPDGVSLRTGAAVQGVPVYAGHPLVAGGLYEARARVYDPVTGRFLEPDPLGYSDSPCLYAYVHHDPIGFVDPMGEVGLLLGLAVAAGVGLVMGAGCNGIRQLIEIHEGSRSEFSVEEMLGSGALGAVAGVALVFAPELAVPLAAMGVASGVNEIARGHWETGAFDVATSLLPFASRSVRSAAFGEGSIVAPARGLGPSATASERVGRFPEIGRATRDLVGRVYNDRFYHGTTYYEATETEQNKGFDLAKIRARQVSAPAPPSRGFGLYFTRTPGHEACHGSAAYWANVYGGDGAANGPATLEASIPRWRSFLLAREPGVVLDVPQSGFDHPWSLESYFPFDGPKTNPPGGPAAHLNALATWRIIDPNTPGPRFNGLAPTLLSPEARWPGGRGPTGENTGKK